MKQGINENKLPQSMMEVKDTESSEKLTDWEQEPDIMDLQSDLEVAKPSRDLRVEKVRKWIDLRNVEGRYKPKKTRGRSSVQPKLIRRQNEWRYAALSEPFLSSKNMYQLEPTTWEDVEKAAQNQLVINNQFRTKLKRRAFIDEVVRTFVDEGSAIIQVGWKRETRMVLVEKPIYGYFELTENNPADQQNAEMLAAALELRAKNYNEYLNLDEVLQASVEYTMENRVPVIAEVIGTEMVEEEEIIYNQPTLDIINYQNFYLDPGAQGDIEKAKFAVVSFETSHADLKKDGRYKNLDKIMWSNHAPLYDTDHDTSNDRTTTFKDDLRKPVIAYQYWGWRDVDGSGELKPILATWIGSTIIRMEENPFPDRKLPIVVIPYMPLKKSVDGEPDAELLEDQQGIIGGMTRGIVDLLGRSANGQTGFAKGMLDTVNRRRYEAGQDYEFNPNSDPRTGVHTHKYPEIPNSALTMVNWMNQEAEALTGVKSFSGGLSGEAYGDVARGIRGMLDAASKREMAILRRLADGMIEIGKKIIAMNAVFLSEEETIRITNDEFVTVRRDELAGEFDVIVDISTAEVEDSQAQDLAFILQTVGPNMDLSIQKLIMAKFAKLKRMPDLEKKIEEFEPQPDPMVQQMQQLELQKLQLEIQEIQSKIALNQAKARETASNADLKDLDFLEQETGTEHARNVDKIKAQAESNADLEITKGLLNQGGEKGPNKNSIREAIAYDRINKALTDRRTN